MLDLTYITFCRVLTGFGIKLAKGRRDMALPGSTGRPGSLLPKRNQRRF